MFQESYHGKGPHDGIGAACKQQVWNKILGGTEIVKSANDLFEVLKKDESEICYLYVSRSEMDELVPYYQKRIEHASPVEGIRQTRWAVATHPYVVSLYGMY